MISILYQLVVVALIFWGTETAAVKLPWKSKPEMTPLPKYIMEPMEVLGEVPDWKEVANFNSRKGKYPGSVPPVDRTTIEDEMLRFDDVADYVKDYIPTKILRYRDEKKIRAWNEQLNIGPGSK